MRLNYGEAALRVCIDAAESGQFAGRLYGQRLREPVAFADASDFLVQIDALLDAQNFPQSFFQLRSFTDRAEPAIPAARSRADLVRQDDVEQVQGAIATVSLQIFTRQRATWQGELDWLDGSPRESFQSSLVLLNLLAARLGC